MPVDVAMAASAPSIAASRASKLRTVGLLVREYVKSSMLAKRRADVSASGCTYVVVRKSASLFSPY